MVTQLYYASVAKIKHRYYKSKSKIIVHLYTHQKYVTYGNIKIKHIIPEYFNPQILFRRL